MDAVLDKDSVVVEPTSRVGAPKKNVIINPSNVASLVTQLINDCNKTQKQIATESGFAKTNIITMIKSGRTKFPIRRTKDFAESVGCDPYMLLETILAEYMPVVLEILETKSHGALVASRDDQDESAMPRPEHENMSAKHEEGRFCMDFYFVHTSGERLYPIKIENHETGKIAFRVSEGGTTGNTKEAGWEVDCPEEMKQYVLEMGCGTRCSTLNKARKGLFSPGGRSVKEVVRVCQRD